MGASRQNADLDAHAAYLNALRWYISGDANYANKTTNILNSWAAAVNVVPSGTDIPGLIGITIAHFAEVGELLRTYSGWDAANFQAYTNIMVTYLYPVCNDFLTNHRGTCNSHYFANWDACNIESLIAMGVLCDNTNIYNQGVNYFKSGAGNGSISNAVPYLYSGGSDNGRKAGAIRNTASLESGCSAVRVRWLGIRGWTCSVFPTTGCWPVPSMWPSIIWGAMFPIRPSMIARVTTCSSSRIAAGGGWMTGPFGN
jgi:hypothetical protein